MHSFESVGSTEKKRQNWLLLEKVMRRKGFVITTREIEAIITMEDETAARVLERLRSALLGLDPAPRALQAETSQPGPVAAAPRHHEVVQPQLQPRKVADPWQQSQPPTFAQPLHAHMQQQQQRQSKQQPQRQQQAQQQPQRQQQAQPIQHYQPPAVQAQPLQQHQQRPRAAPLAEAAGPSHPSGALRKQAEATPRGHGQPVAAAAHGQPSAHKGEESSLHLPPC